MIVKNDIVYCNNASELNKLDIYLPDGAVNQIFVYFHGGGIEGGDKTDGKHLSQLTEQGIAIVCPNYRLYPMAKFPQFIEDATQAVAWVKQNKDIFGNCDKIYVGGSSAGAYLSMMIYFDKKFLAKYQLSVTDFSGFIFDAGQPTAHYNVLRERGIDTRRVIVDNRAPLFFVEEYQGQPPVLIIVADHDMPNRYEQNMLLMSTMKYFNYPPENINYVLMPNSNHCSYSGTSDFVNLIQNFLAQYK